MKVVFTTIRDLVKHNIDILIHEDIDSQVAISEHGYCFMKGGVGVVDTVTPAITEKVFSLFDHFNLNTYMKDRTIEIDPLLPYYSNKTFMSTVYLALITNKYLTMSKLADIVGIDKIIGKKLMAKLLQDDMITSYHTYYKVTTDNEKTISAALENVREEINNGK